MFNKRVLITLILLIFLILACVSCCLISNQDYFTGSRVRNPELYDLDFTRMNQVDDWTMSFNAGDRVHVTFLVEKGNVDLYIGNGGYKCYQGNGITEGDFYLNMPVTGKYTIRVTARNARGRIRIELAN